MSFHIAAHLDFDLELEMARRKKDVPWTKTSGLKTWVWMGSFIL